jgi:hypothetical protein
MLKPMGSSVVQKNATSHVTMMMMKCKWRENAQSFAASSFRCFNLSAKDGGSEKKH